MVMQLKGVGCGEGGCREMSRVMSSSSIKNWDGGGGGGKVESSCTVCPCCFVCHSIASPPSSSMTGLWFLTMASSWSSLPQLSCLLTLTVCSTRWQMPASTLMTQAPTSRLLPVHRMSEVTVLVHLVPFNTKL